MAWRAKSLLIICVVCCVGFILIQEYIRTLLDSKPGLPARSQQQSEWSTKQIVTQNFSKLQYRLTPRPHLTESGPRWTTKSTATSTETSLELGTNDAVTYSHNEFPNREVTTVSGVTSLSIEEEHSRRIRKLHAACLGSAEQRHAESKKANPSEYHYSRRLNFAYCKVPKSGSTFWMKVFLVLSKGESISKLLSLLSRNDIHERAKQLRVDPRKIVSENIRTVVVSRNPYSRLFSAFVDKVYLPLFWEHFGTVEGASILPDIVFNTTKEYLRTSKGELVRNRHMLRFKDKLREHGLLVTKNVSIKITPVCANDVTFESFLRFVIEQAKLKTPLEPHWAPISHMCHPCKINTFKIVKQETFAADVEHTLRSVGMDLSQYDWLKRALKENRVESSVPGIVGVVDKRLSLKQTSLCISHSEVAQRLWKAFQIQGFINDRLAIPDVFLQKHFRFNKQEVTKIILKKISENPITQGESAKQRKKYLVEAFARIPDDVLDQIREIYQLDFTLFDYSELPPITTKL